MGVLLPDGGSISLIGRFVMPVSEQTDPANFAVRTDKL